MGAKGRGSDLPQHVDAAARVACRAMWVWIASAAFFVVGVPITAPSEKFTVVNVAGPLVVQGALLTWFGRIALAVRVGERTGHALGCINTYALLGSVGLAMGFAMSSPSLTRTVAITLWGLQLVAAVAAIWQITKLRRHLRGVPPADVFD